MRHFSKLALSAAIGLCSLQVLSAQDLRPRAYVITPVHSNAVILGYAFNDGSIFFGTVLPITDASGRYSVPNLTYYHSLSFFKRSANVTATLPYVVGAFKGEVNESEQQIYRSGMADSFWRCSVNLFGRAGPDPQKLHEVEAEDTLGSKHRSRRPDRSVLLQSPDQPRQQSVGF